jgi:SAM-dependent methyltransferase
MKFCKLADIADWLDPEFQSIADVLNLGGAQNRQAWESIQVYRGLKSLDLREGESTALRLGEGQAELMDAFANLCPVVVAAHPDSFPQRLPRGEVSVTVEPISITQLAYPDASFDFVWSCGHVAQVNNFRELHQICQEIHRVLKPGGLAAVITGFNVTDRPVYEPHSLFIDRQWLKAWFTGFDPLIQGFELLDQPDYFVADRPENHPAARQVTSAIQVYRNDIVLNSIALFLRKSGEFNPHYHENWLPTFWQEYLAACDAHRTGDFVRSEAILQHLTQSFDWEPRLRVRAFRRFADTLQAQGKLDELRLACEAVLPDCRNAQDEDQLAALANYCTQTGLWDAAQSLYETIETLPSSNLELVIQSLLHQANCYERQSNWEKVLEVVGKAEQELVAGSQEEIIYKPKIYYWTGLAYEKMGQLSPATRFYQLAIEISAPYSDDQLNCYRQLTNCLQTQVKRLKRRVEELESTHTDPNNKFWQLRSRWNAARGFFKRRASSPS